jgi:hypothetical protein
VSKGTYCTAVVAVFTDEIVAVPESALESAIVPVWTVFTKLVLNTTTEKAKAVAAPLDVPLVRVIVVASVKTGDAEITLAFWRVPPGLTPPKIKIAREVSTADIVIVVVV